MWLAIKDSGVELGIIAWERERGFRLSHLLCMQHSLMKQKEEVKDWKPIRTFLPSKKMDFTVHTQNCTVAIHLFHRLFYDEKSIYTKALFKMCSCNQTTKLMPLGAARVLISFKQLHTLSWEILSSVHAPEGHLDLIFPWRKSVLTCFAARR